MNVRRFLLAVVSALIISAAVVPSAAAITQGQPDGTAHPYVGLMVAIDEDGVPQWRCSGSLLSPTVFLTAGHCTEPPAAHIEVWFGAGPILTDPEYAAALAADPDGIVSCNDSPDFDGYPCQGDVGGTPHPNPDFCTGCGSGLPNFANRDAGVVTLDEPVPTSLVGEYAELPDAGLVDTLANRTPIDFVGYGVQFQANIPGKPAAAAAALLPLDRAQAANVCPERTHLWELHAQRPVPEACAQPRRRLGRVLLR